MNKTKRNAWHKHLKKARKHHEKAVLARTGRPSASGTQPIGPARPAARSGGPASRPVSPRS